MNDLQLFKLDGLSMSPFLKSEDRVLINKKFHSIISGHCYLLKKDNRFFVHRYIGNNSFKGDRLIYLDDFDQIIGEVSYIQKDASLKEIKYGFLASLIAFFSRLNLEKYRIVRFLPLFFIIILGKIERLK